MVQKYQLGIGRLVEAETKAAEWETEKEGHQKALNARDEQLTEAVRKNVDLAADLEKAQAEVEQLEEDMHHQRRASVELVTERNRKRVAFEATLEEKRAELESALAKQKAELEVKFMAEFDVVIKEGIREVTAKYKAQVQRICERAWELGWKAALTKASVPEDDPAFRHPPKFQSSGFVPSSAAAAAISTPNPTSEAPPAVNAAPEACPAISEACPANPEANLADSKALQEAVTAQMETDCNAAAATP